MKIIVLLTLIILALPAHAAMTQEQLMKYCGRTWQHQPQDSIIYKPGKSNSKHRPATIQPQLEIAPQEIVIPLGLPLGHYLPNADAHGIDLTQTYIWSGNLSLDGQGNVLLNDMPLPSQALDVLCQSLKADYGISNDPVE